MLHFNREQTQHRQLAKSCQAFFWEKALLTVMVYKYFYDNESFECTENLEGVHTIKIHLILQLRHGGFLSCVIEYIHGTQK